MSNILKIDTGAGIVDRIDPLDLYNEKHPMLKMLIPEYRAFLPNPSMTKLVQRLKMTMKKFGGIGLSANQCGVFERVFVIGTDQFQITCINPKIIAHSEETVKEKEGCLSYPAMYLTIPRYTWIDAEYTTETGETKRVRFEGITARCFQHELDHMNGIVYTTKCKPMALKSGMDKRNKLIKKLKLK